VPLTAAQRQARRRAKRRQPSGPPSAAPARRLSPRPKRWATAVAALIALHDEYRAWLDNLPDNLEGSSLADKLQAIAELDLEELHVIDPPSGTAGTEEERNQLTPKTPIQVQSVFSAPPRLLLPKPLCRDRAPRRRAKDALQYVQLGTKVLFLKIWLYAARRKYLHGASHSSKYRR
jgi:hypothetical protein